MSSFKSVFKDKRSLIFEILFSLEGIVGDLVDNQSNGLSGLELSSLSVKQTIGLSEINLINRLLQISSLYIRINGFVQKHNSDTNPYNRRLAQTMDQLLIDYRNNLIEVEIDINKDMNYSLIKFNRFLKFSQTFEFLNEIIYQFNEEVDSFALTLDLLNMSSLSGFREIQKYAKIVNESSDCLYSDIFSWIIFGFLSQKSENHFFIREKDQKSTLDMTRLPAFISPIDAIKIHKIGESVRSAHKRGVDFLYSNRENELFKRFNELQNNISVDKRSFSEFIEFVRSIVSEHSWNYVVNQQNLKNHLIAIKDFYLTSNDNFWSTFVSNTSDIVLNGQKRYQKDIESAFELSLRQVFTESKFNEISNVFSMTVSKEENNYYISLNYKIPESLSDIVSNDSINKYNKIMNFMANLYSSRYQLNQIWFKTMKPKVKAIKASTLEMKALTLRNSLSFIINCFYYYFKIDVIERLFNHFMDKIEKSRDIEDIQKEHQILLIDIISQMFLKTSVINKCLEQLFSQCNRFKDCLESEELLNQLIEDFEVTKGQTYHLLVNVETYKLNQMISKLVLELEKCSKKQIII